MAYITHAGPPGPAAAAARPSPSAKMTPPAFDFTLDASLAEWNMSASMWLVNNAPLLRERQLTLDGLATGSFVFDPAGRLLVIQRANHDSMPGRWEVPGGAVEATDQTVLHGATRELWEEAGLVAARFRCLISEKPRPHAPHSRPLHLFHNRARTRCFCRCAFLVHVRSDRHVRLDPAEHQAFTWASEDDVRQQTMGPITTGNTQLLMLEAFRLWRELDEPASPRSPHSETTRSGRDASSSPIYDQASATLS